MARTESTMAELGNPAPEFPLPEVIGKGIVSLDTFGGRKALLVMFVCRHCPYVKHVQDELARLGRDFRVRARHRGNQLERRRRLSRRRARKPRRVGARSRVRVPSLLRRVAGRRPIRSRRHARRTSSSMTPHVVWSIAASSTEVNTVRSPGNRVRPSGPPPGGIERGSTPDGAEAESGMQHQVEARQRSRLLRVAPTGRQM